MKRKEYFPICSLKPELPQYQRCYKKGTLQSNIFHEHSFCFKSKIFFVCFSYQCLTCCHSYSQVNWTNTTHFLQIDTIFYDFCSSDNFTSYPTQPGCIWFFAKLKGKGKTREIELTSLNPHTLILILLNKNTKRFIKVHPVLWNDKYGLCIDSLIMLLALANTITIICRAKCSFIDS